VVPRGPSPARGRAGASPPVIHVCAIELPARFARRGKALADVARRLETVSLAADGPPDLVLLPEASLDGYVSPRLDFDLTRFAEPLDGPAAAALAGLARAHRCAIAGPIIERDGDACFNAISVFGADGARVAHYRKRHPWIPETWATAGDAPPPLFEVGGARVTIAICYDVHFVADDAADMLRAADVLLFPSAWVDDGGDARGEILPAIARRFDVGIVNANWGIGHPAVRGQGGSRVVRRDGVTVARARGPGPIEARLA
jgi:predicted amidohydrolase